MFHRLARRSAPTTGSLFMRCSVRGPAGGTANDGVLGGPGRGGADHAGGRRGGRDARKLRRAGAPASRQARADDRRRHLDLRHRPCLRRRRRRAGHGYAQDRGRLGTAGHSVRLLAGVLVRSARLRARRAASRPGVRPGREHAAAHRDGDAGHQGARHAGGRPVAERTWTGRRGAADPRGAAGHRRRAAAPVGRGCGPAVRPGLEHAGDVPDHRPGGPAAAARRHRLLAARRGARQRVGDGRRVHHLRAAAR